MGKQKLVTVGAIVAVLGVVTLLVTGIVYPSEEQIVDFGGFEVTAQTEKKMPLPNWAGGIAIAGGVLLIAAGALRSE